MTKRIPKNIDIKTVDSIINSPGMEPALMGAAVLGDVRVASQDQPLQTLELLAQKSGSGVSRVQIPQGQAEFLEFVREWTAKHKRPVGLGLTTMLVLPLAACGGGGGSGILQPATSSGYVVDGYISGASVSRVNKSGNTVTTDANGQYSGLTGTGAIQSIGGIDIANGGHTSINIMNAPDGVSLVTPLSTLVMTLMNSGGGHTQAQAVSMVQTAFASAGLTMGSNILPTAITTDPAVYKIGLALANVMTAAGGGVSGAVAITSLANYISAHTTVDLTSVSQLNLSTGVDTGTATVLAAQNTTLAAVGSTIIQASVVQTNISGTIANLKAYLLHITPTNIGAIGAVTVPVTGSDDSISVADANTLAAKTNGVVTATLRNSDLASLNTLTGAGNAYSITLSDTTAVSAAVLNALNGKTTVAIDASSVTSISGSYADVNAVYTSFYNANPGFTGLGNETVTLTDASVSVANANVVAAYTTGVVTAIIS